MAHPLRMKKRPVRAPAGAGLRAKKVVKKASYPPSRRPGKVGIKRK